MAWRMSGVADEAADGVDEQIAVHRALGWSEIDLRSIDGIALDAIDRADLLGVADRVLGSGLRVSAICSRIGNWARSIATPLDQELRELEHLADFAHACGSPPIRIMSWPNDGADAASWERRVLSRARQLGACADALGVSLIHENCHGWAATDGVRAWRLMEESGWQIHALFDAGNPVAHGCDATAYLEQVLGRVRHVHVKDATIDADGSVVFTYPGEGRVDLHGLLSRLHHADYAGSIAIEPHVAHVTHLGVSADAQTRRRVYDRYAAVMDGWINGRWMEGTSDHGAG